jgi:hypothetical protein
MKHEKVCELALLMFDSGHLTLPERETLLAEWFEQNPIEPAVVRRSTHPFARSQQYMPDWTNWVDKDGACFWHE